MIESHTQEMNEEECAFAVSSQLIGRIRQNLEISAMMAERNAIAEQLELIGDDPRLDEKEFEIPRNGANGVAWTKAKPRRVSGFKLVLLGEYKIDARALHATSTV